MRCGYLLIISSFHHLYWVCVGYEIDVGRDDRDAPHNRLMTFKSGENVV